MKAVIYYSYDDIRVENTTVPSITDHELLVKVHGCGLCGSDIMKIVQHASPPVKLGHELTGTIVEKGREVPNFALGQRVIVAHHVPCGTCHYCRHGNYSMCASFKASNIDPCGFAEYIRVPAEHVQHATLILPASLGAEEGSFVEPLACCVRAVRRTPLLPGDRVVVMGLGSIGLLMVQAFKALGCVGETRRGGGGEDEGRGRLRRPASGVNETRRGGGGEDEGRGPLWSPAWLTTRRQAGTGRGTWATTRVPSPHHTSPAPTDRPSFVEGVGDDIRIYGVDLLPERLQLARELGADDAFLAPVGELGLRDVLASYTEGRGADAVMITVAGARPFMQAVEGVRKGGTINIFAAQAGAVPVDLESIYQQELSIISTYSSSPEELRIALDLLTSHKVRVDGLISHRLPLEQFAEGVSLIRKRAALKVYFQIAGE